MSMRWHENRKSFSGAVHCGAGGGVPGDYRHGEKGKGRSLFFSKLARSAGSIAKAGWDLL